MHGVWCCVAGQLDCMPCTLPRIRCSVMLCSEPDPGPRSPATEGGVCGHAEDAGADRKAKHDHTEQTTKVEHLPTPQAAAAGPKAERLRLGMGRRGDPGARSFACLGG